MHRTEIETLFDTWNAEAERTARVLASLPAGGYDFRPDPGGRSLGEMAWHLAEVDAYMSSAVVDGRFDFAKKLPGLERPRDVAALAPGFRRVHADAVARLRDLKREDLDRTMELMPGFAPSVRDVVWDLMIHHAIHHRGQLVLLCRLAGGRPPGLFGPNREDTEAMRKAGG